MSKDKLYNILVLVAFVLFVIYLYLLGTKTPEPMPADNVKITTSPDGSSTTVILNSQPGFMTNVQTTCVNGKCTSTTSSTKIRTNMQKMQGF